MALALAPVNTLALERFRARRPIAMPTSALEHTLKTGETLFLYWFLVVQSYPVIPYHAISIWPGRTFHFSFEFDVDNSWQSSTAVLMGE